MLYKKKPKKNLIIFLLLSFGYFDETNSIVLYEKVEQIQRNLYILLFITCFV
jgi:hypothetical protein